ncbi:MAG TPA: hypothetical protein VE224_00480 [Pseudolabrys sp.]|nr:hypothetical protein [Pseudolabrys sp.]
MSSGPSPLRPAAAAAAVIIEPRVGDEKRAGPGPSPARAALHEHAAIQ